METSLMEITRGLEDLLLAIMMATLLLGIARVMGGLTLAIMLATMLLGILLVPTILMLGAVTSIHPNVLHITSQM